MKVDVHVSVQASAWRKAVPKVSSIVREAARAALADEKVGACGTGKAELSVILADDVAVQELNRDFRGKDKPTNVLSFAMTEGEMGLFPPEEPIPLGDIYLAFETVAREAAEQAKTLENHLRHLVIHGVLHLLGYDHLKAREATRMERIETQILARLGIPDPYAEAN